MFYTSTDVATAEPHKAESRVRVLSYPQYCRYRSLQRRIQDRGPAPGGPGLQDPLLLALGALRGGAEDTRVLYCRDAVSHTSLSCCSNLWTPLRECVCVCIECVWGGTSIFGTSRFKSILGVTIRLKINSQFFCYKKKIIQFFFLYIYN